MLHKIFAITLKDLKVLVRDRGGMVALFLMPLMFILVMSAAQQNSYQIGDSDNPVELMVVNNDQGKLADDVIAALSKVDGIEIISELDGQALTQAMAESEIVDGSGNVAVVFPANFTDSVLSAATDEAVDSAVITFIADPSTSTQFLAPIRGSMEGFIQEQAAYAQMPLRIEAGFDQIASESPTEQAPVVNAIGEVFVDAMQSNDSQMTAGGIGVIFKQVAPEAYEVEIFPTAVTQNVPGYTIFGVFFIIQVIATSFLSEKQDGTFRRLLVAPLPRTALLLGKLLPYYLINLVQIAIMFAVGSVVFGMEIGTAPLAMVIIALSTSAAATGLGLLVATLGKTPEQVGGLSTMLALTLAAVGGMMVPSFVMPEFMQTIGKLSPHYWALAGFQDVLVRGLGASDVLNEAVVLCGFALVFFIFGLWRFRFQEE
jgi:ABC-2 type transport system permease protein